MNIGESKVLNTAGAAVRVICPVLALVMALIAFTVYGAPVSSMAVMTAFVIFYLQLPGMLLVRQAGVKGLHISSYIAAGLFAGWAFMILLYFISDFLGTSVLLYVMGPLMSAAYLWSVLKKGGEGLQLGRIRYSGISPAFFICVLLMLLYCMLNKQFVYLSPEISDFTYMNADKAFHMGLINSLSHDYPLQSPWIQGVFFNYHFLSEMMFAVPVRLFGVESAFIMQSFGPYFTTYCMGLSCYAFFREMSSKPERAGIYSLLVILSNIYICRKYTTSLAFVFLLTNDNSSGYGLAAMLVSIIVFKNWYDSYKESSDIRAGFGTLIILTALVMLTTGIKGPMGAVTVAAMWGTMLLGMILRRVSPKSLLPLLIITAGFLLVYLTVLGSKGQANATGASVLAFAKMADISFWKKPLVAALKALGIPKVIRLLMLLLVYMIFLLTVFFVPFCIGYVRELILVLSGRKEYEPAKVLVYAACAVGLVAMLLLNYSGHSQIYFGLPIALLAPMISYWFIEDMEASRDSSAAEGRTLKAVTGVMAFTLVLTCISLGNYYYNHFEDARENSDPSVKRNKYMSISNDEYDAMRWIDENTDADALMATDRYYSVPLKRYSFVNRWDNRFFLYEVYSNRFSYISGSGYILRKSDWTKRKDMIETNMTLYEEDNNERGELARELGVDYVVLSKRFTGERELASEDYELCYSNDDVDIYRVVEP